MAGYLARALVSALLVFIWTLAPAYAEPAQVAKVLDGDSFVLSDGRQVRIIGINAPEFGKDGAPNEPFAQDARRALAALIEGKAVQLRDGAERHDRHGRRLAYVRLPDGEDAAIALLRQGLAFAIALPPNIDGLAERLSAEAQARVQRAGIWSHAYFHPRPADKLSLRDRGFRFVEGIVRHVGQTRNTIYLDLSEHISLAIARRDWQYFGGDPRRFAGKRITARGWIGARKNRLHMRLSHPSMLEVLE